MPKTTRLANRTVARKPAEARPSTPAPSVTKPKKASAAKPVALAAVPAAQHAAPSSTVHFDVHPGIAEIHGYAQGRGWLGNGWTQLIVPWQDMIYTTDHWKTSQQLKSAETPALVDNGRFTLNGVAPGTEVEFALHVGIACRDPGDAGGEVRERGDVWLNNGGQNFRQATK